MPSSSWTTVAKRRSPFRCGIATSSTGVGEETSTEASTTHDPDGTLFDIGIDLDLGASDCTCGNAAWSFVSEIAQAIKTDLGRINVIVDPVTVPSYKDLVDSIRQGKSDLFLYTWSSILGDAEIFLAPIFGSGSPDNLTRYSNPQVDTLLEQVGLSGLADRPSGLLAYGQKRALEMALVLALDPKVMLLDEPTAGMGIEDVDRTIELVRRIAEGRTVVFVDHNMHVVGSLASTVTVLQSGQVLAEGSYDDVRNDERVITAYLGAAHD